MGIPAVADFSRKFAVMVRVQGPDPKGLKMRRHAFHHYNSGRTTLSASGMLLPNNMYDADFAHRNWGVDCALVVTVASVVEPFLLPQYKEKATFQGQPQLISGARVDVMVEGRSRLELGQEDLGKGNPSWVRAQVVKLVDVPLSFHALQSLTEVSSGSSEHGWEVGWSLASYDADSQPLTDIMRTQRQRHLPVDKSSTTNVVGKSNTRIAILGVSLDLVDLPNAAISPLSKRGDCLVAVGSPFGILSPLHFLNSITTGSVANCYPPRSSISSLLMADIRCLPGMEGGPVFSEHTHFVGILVRPLRQKRSGAEIQLVIPWEAIATACSDLLLKEPRNAEKEYCINERNLNAVGNSSLLIGQETNGPPPVEQVVASICLITIDDGVWASGVLLNSQGLILTNAHLLEPWRFGRTKVNSEKNGNKLMGFSSFLAEEDNSGRIVDSSVQECKGYNLDLFYKGRRGIHVRLGHVEPWIWCDARVVYVCKGPLDVALLQLENVPDKIYPIVADFAHPSVGSAAYVIGHGLFGPRCGLSPSVCSGVVAKVVKVKFPRVQSALEEDSSCPVMLETTAAVHPGGSGGAVVNVNGYMIGLVTSNARHGGGTVIPHLNFSIPCAVLAPIFEFARDMQDFSILQKLDQPNKHLASVWALMPPLSPKQSPDAAQSLLQDNREGKGSRFAKFMAESQDVMKRSTQVGNVEPGSSEIFRSKL